MLLTKQERAKQTAARKKQQNQKPSQKKKQAKSKKMSTKLRPSRFARSSLKNKPSSKNKQNAPSRKDRPAAFGPFHAWRDVQKALGNLSDYATSKGINTKWSKGKGVKRRAEGEQGPSPQEGQRGAERYKKAREEQTEAQKMLEHAAEIMVAAKGTSDQLALDLERTEIREVAFLEAQDQAEQSKVKHSKEGKELGVQLRKCNELLEEAQNLTGKQVPLHSFLEAC